MNMVGTYLALLAGGWSVLAAHGCSVYGTVTPTSHQSATADDSVPSSSESVAALAPPDAAHPATAAGAGGDSAATAMRPAPTVGVMNDQSEGAAVQRVWRPTLRIEHSERFDGYLTDGFGRALYMFTADTPGRAESACLDACADAWPPFHLIVARLDAGLVSEDIGEFHRQDGLWQTSYKGHPLYYRASEEQTIEVTGDGLDQRWFVARDYLLFLATTRTFTPAAGDGPDDNFLTDGEGRTIYVCLDDQPRTATHEAVSSCDTRCTLSRPIVPSQQTERTTLLPSVLDPSQLRELLRPDGQRQLTYRGWPLYRYAADSTHSPTEGHNERSWRAIDPVAFGLDD